MHVNIVAQFFGGDAFAQYGIYPFWERAHSGFMALYAGFLLSFIFISVVFNGPHCLPLNGTSAFDYELAESAFVSDYCEETTPWFLDGSNELVVIIATVLYAEAISSFVFFRVAGSAMKVFAEVEADFSSLAKSFPDFDESLRKACMPDLAAKRRSKNGNLIGEQSTLRKLRHIISRLWSHNPGGTVFAIYTREFFVFGCLIANAGAVAYMFCGNIFLKSGDTSFQCLLDERLLGLPSNQTAKFICMRPWTERNDWIVLFYMVAIYMHTFLRFCVVVYFVSRLFCRRDEVPLKSRREENMILLKDLWSFAQKSDEKNFGHFIEHIFHAETFNSMMKNCWLVGEKTDREFAKLVSIRTNRNPPAQANFLDLAQNRRWEWIVELLNKRMKPFGDDPTDWSSVSMSETDDNGCSLLYYALHREPEEVVFNIRAAKSILNHVKRERRVVGFDGVEMDAREFVEMQFIGDSSYPQPLKLQLLSLIETDEDGADLIEISP